MELWRNKVAVVTDASSLLGAALCKDLCRNDVTVVGLASRMDLLEGLKGEILEEKRDSKFIPVQCDVTMEEEIQTAFSYVDFKLGGVDILINNAEVTESTTVLGDENNLNRLKKVVQVNLTAAISCAKKAYKSMAKRNVPGYIINVSSVAGYSVETVGYGLEPTHNLYNSSKFALRALTQVIRHELNFLKKNQVRISSVSPGEIDDRSTAEDVSNVILYLLGTNPRVQTEDVIIRMTGR